MEQKVNIDTNPLLLILVGVVAFWVGFPYGLFSDPSKSVGIIRNWSLYILMGIYVFVIFSLILKTLARVRKWVELPTNQIILFLSCSYLSFVFGAITRTLYTGVASLFS